jgi:hypothetical protein
VRVLALALMVPALALADGKTGVFNYAMRLPVGVANVGTLSFPPQSPGVRIWNGACLWLGYQSSATTATTINGDFWIMNR